MGRTARVLTPASWSCVTSWGPTSSAGTLGWVNSTSGSPASSLSGG